LEQVARNLSCRVRPSLCPSGVGHFDPTRFIACDTDDLGSQARGRRVGLSDANASSYLRQRFGVLLLMDPFDRERDQDRRASDGAELGERAGAGASDEEIGPSELARDVIDESHHLGVLPHSELVVAAAHVVFAIAPGLMKDTEPGCLP
jgi:hypothetical protein